MRRWILQDNRSLDSDAQENREKVHQGHKTSCLNQEAALYTVYRQAKIICIQVHQGPIKGVAKESFEHYVECRLESEGAVVRVFG